jgi:hypothetical protein
MVWGQPFTYDRSILSMEGASRRAVASMLAIVIRRARNGIYSGGAGVNTDSQ